MKIINKILNYLIVAMLLFFVAENIISSQSSTVKIQSSAEPKYNLTLTIDDAKKNFPEADSLVLEDVNLYNVFDDGNKIGTIVNTSPFSDEIYGYNSTTPLTIFLDENDRISEVEICENRETRGYLNKVINSGYLDLWDGLTPKEASTYNVDAVSGCTFTSIAVAQSLQIRMQDLSKEKGKMAIDRKLLARQICIVLVTILAAICFFNPNKTKILRYVTLLLSIAILGFWTNSLLSLALFYNWMTNGISLAIQLPLLIIAVLAILLPLFTKKSFYCQYLCPFGAAQEFVGGIGLKVKGKRGQQTTDNRQQTLFTKANIFNFFAVLRKVILLTLLIIVALGVGLDLSVVEPFPIFNYQSIGFGVAIFAAVIIVASVFIKKPWCNYLCPTGTLLESFRNLRN
ncbi:MAG: 4Fe-4S binding protein [Bacteroidales bacterium]|nr:4Fe-4S binding protein [Bacteroidales bacterium]